MLTPETIASQSAFGLEHIDSLYRYAMALTRNPIEAEDLVQETYVRAIEAFERLKEDSNVRAWLFTILRNLWLNELRRQRNGPQLIEADRENENHPVDSLIGNMPNAYEILESEENAKQVREAIDRLPPDFREILILREFEELSYQEIATVLECPAGTVMSRLGRARSRLRVLLTQSRPSQNGKPQ